MKHNKSEIWQTIYKIKIHKQEKILKRCICCLLILCIVTVSGCGTANIRKNSVSESNAVQSGNKGRIPEENQIITPKEEITELENGFSSVHYASEDNFEKFLWQGGATSDAGVVKFLTENVLSAFWGFSFPSGSFGCSTLSAANPEGGYFFGRNFDWMNCNALVVVAEPKDAYASVSTVNQDFIAVAGKLPNQIRKLAAMYAPLDGMNEKGLCASVNMIEDYSSTINQSTGKPGITTTTAIRLLLDQAGDTDEAISLLQQYDMHASMGYMVHFAIADARGKSVAAEYINNELVITDTSVLTNYYIAPGDKKGIGTEQSHARFDTLSKILKEKKTMTADDVRDALESVSKHHYQDHETTEWSVVMDQANGIVQYFHREDYSKKYVFSVMKTKQ
jgi:predicted choloylglycine hydrolase